MTSSYLSDVRLHVQMEDEYELEIVTQDFGLWQ